MSEPVLHARLSAGYGKTTVLHEVELDLQQGDCLGLAGTSGAGKSTLVLALLGLLPWRRGWARGEVLLRGRDGKTSNLLALNEREVRHLRGRDIALVPQSPLSALNPALSLRTQLKEAWKAHEPASAAFEGRVASLMARVQLPGEPEFLARRPGEISVGQAQRLVLALALLHRPAVLVADEPTSALDPGTQCEVLDLLRSIQRDEGTSLLFISHDLISLLRLCQYVAILDGGRVILTKPIRNLADEEPHPALHRLLRTLPVPLGTLLAHLPGTG